MLHGPDSPANGLADAATAWMRDRAARSPVGVRADRADVQTALTGAISDAGLGVSDAWDQFCRELRANFCPLNAAKLARDKLHVYRQTGSLRDYIAGFRTLILDVPGMSEDEKLDKFCRGLSYNLLRRELDLLVNLRVVVCLGNFAYAAIARELGIRPRPKFGHGVEAVAGDVTVICSFHPSQQNTFTGKLTEPMLDAVFSRARALAG